MNGCILLHLLHPADCLGSPFAVGDEVLRGLDMSNLHQGDWLSSIAEYSLSPQSEYNVVWNRQVDGYTGLSGSSGVGWCASGVHFLQHFFIPPYNQARAQGAGNFAELCSKTARGISSNYARNSRITVGFLKRLAKYRETRKACSGTFAKLASMAMNF